MPVSEKTNYIQHEGFTAIEVPEGLVLLRDAQELHHLNHAAAVIYLLCARPIDGDTILRVLREEFATLAIQPDEVSSCLRELVQLGALRAE